MLLQKRGQRSEVRDRKRWKSHEELGVGSERFKEKKKRTRSSYAVCTSIRIQ
jgi:hypothetical protein